MRNDTKLHNQANDLFLVRTKISFLFQYHLITLGQFPIIIHIHRPWIYIKIARVMQINFSFACIWDSNCTKLENIRLRPRFPNQIWILLRFSVAEMIYSYHFYADWLIRQIFRRGWDFMLIIEENTKGIWILLSFRSFVC